MSNPDLLKFAVQFPVWFFSFNFKNFFNSSGHVSPSLGDVRQDWNRAAAAVWCLPLSQAHFSQQQETICVLPEFLRRWKCQDQVMTPVFLIFGSFKCSGTESHFSLLSVPGAVFRWGFCPPWVCCFPLSSRNKFFPHFPVKTFCYFFITIIQYHHFLLNPGIVQKN